MQFIKSAAALGLAVSFCIAAPMSISGTVIDSLNPTVKIPGAHVTLKNCGLTTTTDANGAFTITRSSTDIIGGTSHAIAPAAPVVLSAKGEIQLNLQETARVTVKTYSAQGKQIGLVERTLVAGNHSIMPARTNSGVYLYQVVVNGKAYMLQQANVEGRAFALQQANVNSSTTPSHALAKSAASLAVFDSVIVTNAVIASQPFARKAFAVTDSVVSGLSAQMTVFDHSCPFITDVSGGTSMDGYYLHNNLWNQAYLGRFTSELYACSGHYLYFIINMNDDDHNGNCKSFQNVHKDYNPMLAFSSMSSLTVDFASSEPHGASMNYEAAFDIWVNGVASNGCTEFMIWNDNWGQTPAGTKQFSNVTIDGRQYNIYRSQTASNNTQDIVSYAVTPYTSAHQDIMAFFNYAIGLGWLPAASSLGQLDYGFEMVSTNHLNSTFLISSFTINDGQ